MWDHPRSRGVYDQSGRADRGLLGIIPARAGFTIPGAEQTNSRPDHPRSRGVYPHAHEKIIIPSGSSPLARGLH